MDRLKRAVDNPRGAPAISSSYKESGWRTMMCPLLVQNRLGARPAFRLPAHPTARAPSSAAARKDDVGNRGAMFPEIGALTTNHATVGLVALALAVARPWPT